MLSVLVPKVERCKEALNAQAVSNALYGMQGMSRDIAEVRAILSAVNVGQNHATFTITKPIATPTTAPISSLRRVPIVHTVDDKMAVNSSNTTHTGMKEGSDIQIVEEQIDIKLEKSFESQVMNPITKRMIRIDGVTYNKLIRLGYTFTDDRKLILLTEELM